MFHESKPFHMRWNKYNEINEYCCRCLYVCMRGGLWNVICACTIQCLSLKCGSWQFSNEIKIYRKANFTCVGVCCVETTMRFACTVQSLFAANIIGTESSFGLKFESKIQKWRRTNENKNKQTNNKNAYFSINIWIFGVSIFVVFWVRVCVCLCVDWRIKMQWTKYTASTKFNLSKKCD